MNIVKSNRKYTSAQKAILKELIDADLSISSAAELHGHTSSNASLHFLRENKEYFSRAIEIKKSGRVAATG